MKLKNSFNSIEHVLNSVLLDSDEWEQLQKDFQENETKSIICAKYNLKGYQFKALKKYILGEQS